MTDAVDALIAAERLPSDYRHVVDAWWRPLARDIAARRHAAGRPLVVAINGAQGSGKSTLCRFLAEALLPESGLAAAVLSIDDLYLTRAERQQLARTVHPLFATRGVPGTHDVALGLAVIDALLAPGDAVAVPRFDKARDDRRPRADWPRVMPPVDVLLFEGWCVGAMPQEEQALAEPVNALETTEDDQGLWRRHVNAALAGPYRALFGRIDLLVMLRPPGFEAVVRNRLLQEEKLHAADADGGAVMDESAIRRFVAHYERLTRDMFVRLAPRADVLFDLDDQQNIIRRTVRG